jgi:Flp pilus assembly protein TadD
MAIEPVPGATFVEMAPGIRLIAALIFLWEFLASPPAKAAATDPDKDVQLQKFLEEARALIDAKKAQVAIEKCDKVIAAFAAHYAKSEHKVYCARTSSENLSYLMKAAAAMNKGEFEKGKKDAIVLSSTWASAYYMKGWALEELNKLREARAAIKEAIELSPCNSQYGTELGYLYTLEKDWAKAEETYRAAEEHASLSPDDAKQIELARARRGTGYVLVELGRLDEAEEKYLQCLKDDPNDKKAAAELEYVRNLKAKTKS